MKFSKTIKIAQFGTSLLILKARIQIIVAVIHSSDFTSYMELIARVLEMAGFMLLYVFFDNMTDKLNNLKDK